MYQGQIDTLYRASIGDKDFKRLSTFIQSNYGIKMPDSKRVVLQGRLQKRLKKLNFMDYTTYCDYVFSPEGQNEIIHMIDVVSTNKTDFYREPVHFEYLSEQFLNNWHKNNTSRGPLKIWSAGCSSGEEPYTLALVLMDFKEKNPGFDFRIVGTDISTAVLQQGANAVYKPERINVVPLNQKKKYFLRSKDESNPLVRLIKPIRDRVTFRRLNFMDSTYNLKENFDIIFCRNALIYFERDVQEKVINKLCANLNPNGFFFLGHSESITNMQVPLKGIRPTIFQKK